jgi:arylsulfatase A-like enzyme
MSAWTRCPARAAGTWALVAACALGCAAPEPVSPGDVDVVIYVVDTLRRDRLGFYGYPKPTSPFLDALARESVVFDDAYAAAPWTLPSVASLLTGLDPLQHGAVYHGQRLDERFATLPQRLRELGYRTAAFSANPVLGEPSGLPRRFERYHPSRRTLHTKAVEGWLDEVGDAPFFMYVQTLEPHVPYLPPEPHLRRFTDRRDSQREIYRAALDARGPRKPEATSLLEQQREYLDALYDGSVAWADDRLAKLVGLLQRRGRWERTLLVFVSDHGEELLDHGGTLHGHTLHDELIRVPMLWRFPRGEAGDRRVRQRASHVDVAPTVLAYLGRADLAEGLPGRSLLADMRGRERRGPAEPWIASVRFADAIHTVWPHLGQRNLAVLEGGWKAIWRIDDGAVELYDLSRDPGERHDVAASNAERVQRLRGAAEAWLAARPAPAPPPSLEELKQTLGPRERESLRALGYLW